MNDNKLFIYDCLTRKLRAADGAIMTIGAGSRNTFILDMEPEEGGSFALRNDNCHFFPHSGITSYALNSTQQQSDVLIAPFKFYLFILGKGCFICWFGPSERMPNFAAFNPDSWYLYDQENNRWSGPVPLVSIPQTALSLPETSLATFEGLDRLAFLLKDILPVAQRAHIRTVAEKAARQQEAPPIQPMPAPPKAREEKEVLCPACWKSFPASNIMSIAVHGSLRGDDLLGEEAMRRFWPSSFNEKGAPLDAQGMPCPDYACPHCRHKLPPFFLKLPQLIFSIVGAPSSGKSYYLTTLIRQLELELPRDFGVSFRDSDPVANAPLNAMKTRLFAATSPSEAHLLKTGLEGQMYDTLPRNGHMVKLPKPFIYNVQKGKNISSIVFYDNAGEHFEPGRHSEESPGTQHVSVASAIFFLFDPTSSPAFRRLLQDNPDPQFRTKASGIDQQDVILTETEVRIKTALFMPPHEKLDIPFAFIVGKSDIWQHLLGPEPLLPIVREGYLLPEHIEANSTRLRNFMFGIHPDICSNAEAISSNVKYFAVSPLGSSPVEVVDKQSGDTFIAPDPRHLNPQRVCDPTLWALHCLDPQLFPTPNA